MELSVLHGSYIDNLWKNLYEFSEESDYAAIDGWMGGSV